jgi:integrase
MLKKVSKSTVAQNLYALRAFLKYLMVVGIRKDSPADLIEGPRVSRPLPQWHSVEKLRKLIDAAAENTRDYALVQFMWATGTRIAEVVGFDWHGRTAKALGKGDKERLVPLTKKAVETLQAYLRTCPHIGETAYLPAQEGGVQLQDGRSWVAFWRENRTFPDGTVKRVLRSKTIGMTRRRRRNGQKPTATITLAADLRRAQGWPWRSRNTMKKAEAVTENVKVVSCCRQRRAFSGPASTTQFLTGSYREGCRDHGRAGGRRS